MFASDTTSREVVKDVEVRVHTHRQYGDTIFKKRRVTSLVAS